MKGRTPEAASAHAAGLHYVSDARPGIRREMGPLGFKYIGVNGRVIRKPSILKRLRALAIPPAWTDVWICPHPRGHIQATGRDAKGRKQYRYHAAWREQRDQTKYYRMLAFAATLPAIRRRTHADLAKSGLPREKVVGSVVQLLEKSLIRVGNDEYAKSNQSYGLTTMRNRHVEVKGSVVKFVFKGKSGIRHSVDVDDKRLARVVRACQDLPGQQLFEYFDEEGHRRGVGSADVNAYLKDITGEDFTAKDFRTWAGTVLACSALQETETFESMAEAKRNVVRAIEAVAGVLGNTRAVCRKSYIHPAILDAYMDGSLAESVKRRTNGHNGRFGKLRPDEAAAVAVLQRQLTRESRKKAA